MGSEFKKTDDTLTVKGKDGKITNNISLRGKKGIIPPAGFALLSSSKNKVKDSSQDYAHIQVVGEKARRAIWANLIANSTCESVSDIGSYQIVDSSTLAKLSKDTDMIEEPNSPIFTDGQQDSIEAFFKTKIEKVVQMPDGSKELFYSVPGLKAKDGLQLSFRQKSNLKGEGGQISLVLLDRGGSVAEVLEGNKINNTVNEYVSYYSSVTPLTRGELQLNCFVFHVDKDSDEISILEAKVSTDWFPSDLDHGL